MNKKIWLPFLINKKTLGKYVMKRADRIIALTQRVKDGLISNGINWEKITVVSTGVPTDLYNPSVPSTLSEFGVKDDDKVVLFVGRLVENKGVHILLNAFRGVQNKVENAKLLIIGKGKMEDDLRLLAKELGIEKSILFLGKFPQEIMPSVYSGADVFVLPTLHSEPFGIAAVEALSSGVPTIASSIGGLKGIVEHGETGFLINSGDTRMLETRLVQLL